MAKAITADKPAKSEKPAKTPKASKSSKPNVFKRLGQYFKDVRSEMRRVVWPNRTEIYNSSVVVIVTLVVFGIGVALLDTAVVYVLGALAKIRIGG
jgi:preprotein translocase subunit SecE